VLRTLSYYEMKNRAGVVGQKGLGPLLSSLAGPGRPPRIHLMGHSFGARLASYTLSGLPEGKTGAASPVKSLTLIQGAFSHFTFASSLMFDPSRSGALAGCDARVDGPLLATFTAADRAVGWWYPAASMLSGQDSQSAADLAYRWGAMGHDGYQQDPAPNCVVLAAPGTPYAFHPTQFYALDANAVICANQSQFSGAHSDIRHPEVLWAVASAANLAG
jgi:pimeloyl-ACP methyl ester carboxylesterase